jgi:CheY-like chemotaxis protein
MTGKGEMVLLVEDEKSVRVTVAAFLEDLDYRVLVAESPRTAQALASKQPGLIDLLITDIVMPQMSGHELARTLVENSPGMKCVFMSGYSAGTVAGRGELVQGQVFLSKPFSKFELARAVRAALDNDADADQASR